MIETKPRINRGNRGQLFRATWLNREGGLFHILNTVFVENLNNYSGTLNGTDYLIRLFAILSVTTHPVTCPRARKS